MFKIFKKIFNRFNLMLLLLLLQIVSVIILTDWLTWNFFYVYLAFLLLALVAIFSTLRKDEASEYKLIWILAMSNLGVYGVIFYYTFRNNRGSKDVGLKVKKEVERTKQYHQQDVELLKNLKEQNARFYGMSQLTGDQNYTTYTNTVCKYYPFGQDMFEDMLNDLKSAKNYIFMEYFIIHEGYMWSSILQVLIEKAREGVEIKLMTDGVGSSHLFSKKYINFLKAHNIEVHFFSPLLPILAMLKNNRDHRKILVVDGTVAFNGGINIGDEYINKIERFGTWKDTGLRLHGPAAWGFALMFLQMWQSFSRVYDFVDYEHYKVDFEKGQDVRQVQLRKLDDSMTSVVIPFGVSPFGSERLGENVYIEILNKATNYVYLTTPYLILSEKMIHALRLAAKRGVDVRILMPGIPDKKLIYRVSKSYYRYLLNYGIAIYEYTPGFLHAKMFVSDDEIAVVGTINLDYRSLYLHFECGTLLCNKGAIADIKHDFLDTMAQSRQVLKPSRRLFVVDTLIHIFTPLM